MMEGTACSPTSTHRVMPLKHSILFLFLIHATCLLSDSNAQTEPRPDLWAINDTTKIKREDIYHLGAYGNSVWNGTDTITLVGMRNEVLAFQIIVEGAATVQDIAIELGDTDLNAGVEVFTQHYLEVDHPSVCTGWGCEGGTESALAPGWIPGALIPSKEASSGLGGFPLTIAPDQLQGFFVDLYIGREVASGSYHGTVEVTTDTGIQQLELMVDVHDYTLPDEDYLDGWMSFNYNDVIDRHGPTAAGRKDLFDKYRFLFKKHRLIPADRSGDPYFADANMDAYLPYLNGEAYTTSNGYDGPGRGIGHKVFPIQTFGAHWKRNTDPPGWTLEGNILRESDAWQTFFESRPELKDVKYFLYVADESYHMVEEYCTILRNNPGPGRNLPVLITKFYDPNVPGITKDMIDYWTVPVKSFSQQARHDIEQDGDKLWVYHGWRPYTGMVYYDAPGLDMRTIPWILWYHKIDTWLFWESNWWSGTQWRDYPLPDGTRTWAPRLFSNVWTYAGSDGSGGSIDGNASDGILLYPGTDVIYPDESRGIDGPIGSLMLKSYRRGQQDVAIMEMAKAAGHEEQVRNIVFSIIGRTLDEVEDASQVDWNQDASAWDSAIEQIRALFTEDTTHEDSDNDGMYDVWETAHGLDTTINDSQLDPDKDGMINLLEFALDSDPQLSSTEHLPRATIIHESETYLALAFRKLKLSHLNYQVETSDDLIHWTPLVIETGSRTDHGKSETVTIRHGQALDTTKRAFVRLKIVKLDPVN